MVTTGATTVGLAVLLTGWIAFPTNAEFALVPPLQAWTSNASSLTGPYARDFAPLAAGFRSQSYRSFCGPASVATVLRAYGTDAEQTELFPSWSGKLDAFYTGMSLVELAALAQQAGLRTEVVYADQLTLTAFRERLKANLAHDGDFAIVNYDRRVLKQSGAGHISPISAYDEARDAFLVMDQAAYKYPFTWIPAPLLYSAMHTRDGDRYRGMLFIQGYESPN